MLKTFRGRSHFQNFSISCKGYLNECKTRVIITQILLLMGLIVGIFMAIRLNNDVLFENLEDFDYLSTSLSKISSFSSFFWRIFSLSILMLILFLLSLTPFLYIIAEVVLVYRSYLLGFNIVLIIVKNGFGGFFTTIFIILPIQILLLNVLSTFFCVLSKKRKDSFRDKWKIILSVLCLLLILVLIESLLLVFFSANIILVI